jgi:hypothetical protein
MSNGTLWGFSNVEFGASYQVSKKKLAASIGMDFSTQTFRSSEVTGLRTGYEKWTLKPNVSVGMGFDRGYFSATLSSGISTNGYSEELGLIVDGGYKAGDKFWIGGYGQYLTSFKNGDFRLSENPAFSETVFYDNDEHFIVLGLKLSYTVIDKLGISATPLWTAGFDEGWTALSLKVGLFWDW